MRLQPPPSPNKWDGQDRVEGDDIPVYLKAHVVVGFEEPIPVLEFLEILIMDESSVYKSWTDFLSMWPDAYEDAAFETFYPELLRIWKKKEEEEGGSLGSNDR